MTTDFPGMESRDFSAMNALSARAKAEGDVGEAMRLKVKWYFLASKGFDTSEEKAAYDLARGRE